MDGGYNFFVASLMKIGRIAHYTNEQVIFFELSDYRQWCKLD